MVGGSGLLVHGRAVLGRAVLGCTYTIRKSHVHQRYFRSVGQAHWTFLHGE